MLPLPTLLARLATISDEELQTACEERPEEVQEALRRVLREGSLNEKQTGFHFLERLGEPVGLPLVPLAMRHLERLPLSGEPLPPGGSSLRSNAELDAACLQALGSFSSQEEEILPLLLQVFYDEGRPYAMERVRWAALSSLLRLLPEASRAWQDEFVRRVVEVMDAPPAPHQGGVGRVLPPAVVALPWAYRHSAFQQAAARAAWSYWEAAESFLRHAPPAAVRSLLLRWMRLRPDHLHDALESLEVRPEPVLDEATVRAVLALLGGRGRFGGSWEEERLWGLVRPEAGAAVQTELFLHEAA